MLCNRNSVIEHTGHEGLQENIDAIIGNQNLLIIQEGASTFYTHSQLQQALRDQIIRKALTPLFSLC